VERATFGMGCFWGPEESFRKVDGVTSTSVGFMGGSLENPTYEEVCTGRTGHAEVVAVEFDPSRIAYEEILEIFWACHDPTTRNRQGPDIGTQYRSVLFFHSPEQEAAARASKEKLERSGRYRSEIVTEIVPASSYYPADEYHQRYLEKRRERW
jgi:peptide-methionine (S)-S-oxide reductase